MKLLRVGQKGKEKPAILDNDGKIRDISSHVKDLNPDFLNFKILSQLKNIDLKSLPELSSSDRVGSCIVKPGKFVAIGLNFSDHAAESNLPVPSEPIMFMKATSSINGPNDNIEILPNSKKLDWEVELGIIIGKETKHIKQNQAQDHILGYCLVNDVSEREWQIEKMGQWVKGKSHDTSEYIGHEQIITFDFSGQQLLGKFSSTIDIDINKEFKLNMDINQFSVFDTLTEERI